MRSGVGRQIQALFMRRHDVSQAVNGLHHLGHALIVFALHGGHDLHGLRQGIMPFGELIETFFECHSIPRSYSMIAVERLRDVFCMHGS